MMVDNGAVGKDWVKENIESRVARGENWAKRLTEHSELAKTSRYIRILGNEFRPVSISEVNPCGRLLENGTDKVIDRCDTLEEAINRARSAKVEPPQGNKPEHRLQAFLIRTALQNELRFGQALPDFSCIFDKLLFITDELAVITGTKDDDCRPDVIALGGKGKRFFPVFIELKNKRHLDELKGQLDNADRVLWKDKVAREPFRRFLSAVSSIPLEMIADEGDVTRKMLIWPKSPSGREDKRVQQARETGYLIVEFEKLKDTYKFSRKLNPERSKE